ncbi:MAG: GntR family transcriptional regulator [Verrucomicrobiae bacterium]|nr:GntR family transcriptional regulator [Verrucomicrobiae bacterium]
MNLRLDIKTANPVHLQIEQFLRREIQTGKLNPGERLPATDVLAREWRVDQAAIQKAMVCLVADGFIERRRKRGTFVKSRLDKAVIGVLIGRSLADETAHFHRAVLAAIRSEMEGMEDCNWMCRVYDGLNELRNHPDFRRSATYQQLVRDRQHYPFKGIIKLRANLTDVENNPGPDFEANLPVCRLGPALKEDPADVLLDYRCFGRESVEFIARKGLKKIAYLRVVNNTYDLPDDLAGINEAVQALQLPQVEIHAIQHVLTSGAFLEQAAHEKTLELIDRWQSRKDGAEWPDALLVSDDIAMRGAALALARKGIEVPNRLLVATAANESIVHHYGIPVARYEYSITAAARELLRILWNRMTNRPAGDLPVRIGGRFKDVSKPHFLSYNDAHEKQRSSVW